MSDYQIDVRWNDEAKCYVADIPDLSYCSAFGATPQEALAGARFARDLWLAAALVQGRPIPPPRYRSDASQATATPCAVAS